jgi:hypothetical protein
VGSTPATTPTQNKGFDAAAIQTAGAALRLLEMAAQKAGAQSELGIMLYKFIPKLAEMIPPGAVSPAGQKNELENQQLRNAQQGQQVQQLRQSMAAGGGAGGGGAGGPAGGGMGMAA